MPELDIVYMEMCASLEHSVTRKYPSKSKPENSYTTTLFVGRYDGSCDCWPYKKTRWCLHLDMLLEESCSYHEQVHGSPDDDGICPHCGGPTVPIRVGV